MRRASLILLVWLLAPAFGQPGLELLQIEETHRPSLSRNVKPPSASDSGAVRAMASKWLKAHAKARSWKAGRCYWVGELTGRPADEFPVGRYQVYRILFESPPYLGGELQTDFLFYGRGNQMVWPPEHWSKDRPPPGQMPSIVRDNLGY